MMMDHAPNPADCFRRAITAAHAMQRQIQDAKRAKRSLDPAQDGPALAQAIMELAHLAVLDDRGLLAPVYEALRFAVLSPEEAADLDHARRSWERQQAHQTPPP